MFTNSISIITAATPTNGVKSNECLMARAEMAGHVVGFRVFSGDRVKTTLLLHIWDDIESQKKDKNLERDLKKVLKTLGGGDIIGFDIEKGLNHINTLIKSLGMTPIDNKVTSLYNHLEHEFEDVETLMVNLGIPTCDIEDRQKSTLVQLDVTSLMWKQYFKATMSGQNLLHSENDVFEQWASLLSRGEKIRVRNIHKDNPEVDNLETALILLERKGVSKEILNRLSDIDNRTKL